jgi:hypothetical protein
MAFAAQLTERRQALRHVASFVDVSVPARPSLRPGGMGRGGRWKASNFYEEEKDASLEIRQGTPYRPFMFRKCESCEYTLAVTAMKVVILDCVNTTIRIRCEVIGTLELINCANVTVHVENRVPVITVDSCRDCSIAFAALKYETGVVWANVINLRMKSSANKISCWNIPTLRELGSNAKHDSYFSKTTQFVSSFASNGSLFTERIVREGSYPIAQSKFLRAQERDKQNAIKLLQTFSALAQ